MLQGFVWFENSEKAVNTSLVTDFWIHSRKGKSATLRFQYVTGGDGVRGTEIQDPDDITNFLKNVAKLDTLPTSLVGEELGW